MVGSLDHVRIICFHNPWYITDAGVPALLQGLYSSCCCAVSIRSKHTREMRRRSSRVLFTYFQFACSYLLTSPPPVLATHLCLWSRCSKHSCIAPVWTSADGVRVLFGLDQHPSTCKPGHLSPSHLKIEREESQLWYWGISHLWCSQCDSSISGVDSWRKWRVNKSSIILSMALKVLSLKCLRCR